jgi:hypothetical protein
VAKPASINLRKLVLSPTVLINLGFILREDLLLCSSYLPLGVPNWVPNKHYRLPPSPPFIASHILATPAIFGHNPLPLFFPLSDPVPPRPLAQLEMTESRAHGKKNFCPFSLFFQSFSVDFVLIRGFSDDFFTKRE